ncbi:MAG: AAA family ATPase [Thiohalomonadaceae bacterium]
MKRVLGRQKDSMASPPYLSRYGLRESPFASGSRFFYADPTRAQTLNMLQHLTQYSEELLLVSGPSGSGKSAMLEQYLTRADEDWKVCRVSARETPDPGQLFLVAARCFGLRTEDIASDVLLDALRDHLNHLQQTMVPVLVVDDAELLSDDALEVIVRLAELPGEHGRLVRTILFTDSAILPRFDEQRFASAPRPHRLELSPLDEEQTIAYLQHRLSTAGFAGGPLFLPRELKRVHKQSLGWPGGINEQAHAVLLGKRKRSRMPWSYLLVALGVAGILAIWLPAFFTDRPLPGFVTPAPPVAVTMPEQPIVRYAETAQPVQSTLTVRGGETVQITCIAPEVAETSKPQAISLVPAIDEAALATSDTAQEKTSEATVEQVIESSSDISTPTEQPAVSAAVETTTELSDTVETVAAGKADIADESEAVVESASAIAQEPDVPAAAVAVAEPEPEAEPQAGPKAEPEAKPELAPVIERIEPVRLTGSHQVQSLTLHGRHFSPASKVIVRWQGQQKILGTDQVQILDAERIRIRINVGMTADTWSAVVETGEQRSAQHQFRVVAPAKQPEPKVTATPVVSRPGTDFRDANWLRLRDPAHFTVQLVGASTLEAIHDHLRGHALPGEIAMVRMQRSGKPWFIVFWGDFIDQAAAERAVNALPSALRQASPWVRPLADIHKEL